MGQTLSAHLCYGWPLPSLNCDGYELTEEWRDEIAPKQPEDTSDYKSDEWEKWRADSKEWKKSCENIEISWAGSDGGEGYYIHAESVETSSIYDEREDIIEHDHSLLRECNYQLNAFCDKFNLPKRNPRWFICARLF